ncbi:hypothetical protein [Rothia sp. P7208]
MMFSTSAQKIPLEAKETACQKLIDEHPTLESTMTHILTLV